MMTDNLKNRSQKYQRMKFEMNVGKQWYKKIFLEKYKLSKEGTR